MAVEAALAREAHQLCLGIGGTVSRTSEQQHEPTSAWHLPSRLVELLTGHPFSPTCIAKPPGAVLAQLPAACVPGLHRGQP